MRIEYLDGKLWAKMVEASGAFLEENKIYVDSLNVFPVPDGDTGTNMSLTMASAIKAVSNNDMPDIGEAAQKIAYGALMGARGNSGVILSQIFAGFAKIAEGKQIMSKQEVVQALGSAVKTAYQAVMNPVEGTILTVSRMAYEAAEKVSNDENKDLIDLFEATLAGSITALKITPELLPVLKQAGVVDAGGQGFVYIIEGMLNALKGKDIKSSNTMSLPSINEKSEINYFHEDSLEFQYCTEFILKKREQDLDLDKIRDFLADKGDCLLVVGSIDTGKIHIHTNNPGRVLEYCTDIGTLHQVQINNMCEQSEEMQLKGKLNKRLGLVGVAVGNGMIEILKSLGVDAVITGGQTMNPSTQDFLDAIEIVGTETVLLLPNNSNVLLTAKQAADLSTKNCLVVETKTVPQGIAALMAYNSAKDIEYNKSKMQEASFSVKTLEVTYAVRSSVFEGHTIKKDQILGIVDGQLTLTGIEPEEVAEKLISESLEKSHELVTVYYGEDANESDAKELIEKLAEIYENVDFELHQGGQPLYYYLISME